MSETQETPQFSAQSAVDRFVVDTYGWTPPVIYDTAIDGFRGATQTDINRLQRENYALREFVLGVHRGLGDLDRIASTASGSI